MAHHLRGPWNVGFCHVSTSFWWCWNGGHSLKTAEKAKVLIESYTVLNLGVLKIGFDTAIFLYGILHEIIYYRLFKPDGGRFQPNVDYHIFQVVVKNRHIGLPFKRMTDCPISRMYTTQHTHEMKFLNTPFQRSQSAVFYFLDRIFPENWPFLKIFGFMRGNGACLFSKDIGDQSYWLLPFVTNVIQGSIRNMSVCFLKERCVILIVLSGVLFQHLEIVVVIFVDPDYMDVSKNNGTPKSSILIGCSIINHPFWGTPIFGNVHVVFSFMTRWSAPFLDPDIFVKKVSLSLWW